MEMSSATQYFNVFSVKFCDDFKLLLHFLGKNIMYIFFQAKQFTVNLLIYKWKLKISESYLLRILKSYWCKNSIHNTLITMKIVSDFFYYFALHIFLAYNRTSVKLIILYTTTIGWKFFRFLCILGFPTYIHITRW